MNAVTQEIMLVSEEHFGKRLPPHEVGVFLAELPLAVAGAVSMALLNRSCPKGRRPDWLRRAADIRFVGHDSDGGVTLYFEAPRLGEAAEELYRQGELFPTRPDAEETALDVFGNVLLDVARQDADSERFDHPLLKRLVRFHRALAGPFTEARLSGRRFAAEVPRLTQAVLQTARRLYEETPPPRKVRLAGTLDMARASNRTFGLRLEGDLEARGCLIEGSIEGLAALLNKPVLVFGEAVFRPSGRLLRVDANEYRLATDADWFFATMPKPLGARKHQAMPQERRKMAEGLKAVIGKWPGEETDEELQAALKELG